MTTGPLISHLGPSPWILEHVRRDETPSGDLTRCPAALRAADDVDAFGRLYDLTVHRMWLVALVLSPDRRSAEDLLARTYPAAWRSLRAPSCSVTAATIEHWLHTRLRTSAVRSSDR